MPLCARCTGIYVGVLLAFCFLLLKKADGRRKTLFKGQAMLTALMILPIGIDGLEAAISLLGKQSAAACAFG